MLQVAKNRELYEQLCHKAKDIPLFFQPWWLDAVAPGQWGAWTAVQGGEPVGLWPLVEVKKSIFRGWGMPLLTPFLGLWLLYPQRINYFNKLAFEERTISAFLNQFSTSSFIEQMMPTYLSNWLPFYWHNFQQTTHYTYLLEVESAKTAWDGLERKTRGEIRNAREIIEVRKGGDSNIIYENVAKSLWKSRKKWVAVPTLVDKVYHECKSRQCGEQYYACDQKGRVHAVVWVVWDHSTAYLLARGGDPALMRSGAMKHIVWSIIEELCGKVSKFDFVGSHLRPVERFIRHFGARQAPMHFIYRYDSKLLSLAKSLRQSFRFGAGHNNG